MNGRGRPGPAALDPMGRDGRPGQARRPAAARGSPPPTLREGGLKPERAKSKWGGAVRKKRDRRIVTP